jgi:starch phosphorylase
MATLNLPAWGYGLMFDLYSFFWIHETIHHVFTGYWSINQMKIKQKFSPWEIVRHDILYPVRFFG